MIGYRLHRSLAAFLAIAALLVLTGCGGLVKGADTQGSVTVGTPTLDFGTVGIGDSKTLTETITNTTSSALTISSIQGLSPEFTITGLNMPVAVFAGQTVSFNVVFRPTDAGDPDITVSFVSPNSQTLATFAVSGVGATSGKLVPNPSQVSFGNIKVGSNQTSTVNLTNSGQTDITITQAKLSGAGFTMGNLSLPLTLHAGSITSAKITFAPPSPGHYTGSATFSTTEDQQNGTVTVNLAGDGVGSGLLTPNPASLAFGSVTIGSSSTLSETLTNTGGAPVTISQVTASGAAFSFSGLTLPVTLAVNQSVSFNAVFTPAASGAASGSLSVSSDASNSPLSIPLSGTGTATGALTANPSSVTFGNVTIGAKQTVPVTVTNTGGTSVTVSGAAATGAGFGFTGPTLPVTLAAGQATTFNTTFTPTAAGAVNGALTITSNAPSGTLTVPLAGTGVAQGSLGSNPTSFSFGNIQVGSSKSLNGSLTNSGGSSITISAASASGQGFSLSGLTLPLTLNAGQSTAFTVTFSPTAGGATTGTATITSNGSNPSLSIPLDGTGVTQGTVTANPTSLAFGNVQVGNGTNLTETLTNSGGSSLTISAASVTGTGFSISGLTLPLTLTAGQSASFTVRFAPSASGSANGNVTITSNGSNPSLAIPLSGTGVAQGALTANPTSLAFGNVQVGSNTTLSETLTNSGGSSITISAASASGQGFSLSGLTLPLTLSAGQSTSFTVQFAPTASGAASGNVTITSNGSNPSLAIPLSGTGVAQGALTANPTSLAFGNVQVGSNATLSETLTNSGGSSITISAAAASGPGFSFSGLTLPLTLTAGQSTSFTVQFAPTASGAASGNVTITSNGSNPSLAIPLTGTGVTQGTLAANPTSLAFGSVQVGNGTNLSETLTNTGGSSLTISAASTSGSGFSLTGLTLPLTLTAGQSASFTVRFAPTASGAVNGNVTITSNGSNPSLAIPLTGTGVTQGDLVANPTSLAFGNVQIGNNASLSETLTNSGGSSVTISAASASGNGFSLTGITLPLTLNAGQSTTFTVQFTPTASGGVSGNVTITSNGSNPSLAIPLSGTGVTQGTLTANPTSLAFSNVQVGSSATLSETLTNSGGSSLTISAASVTGNGFSLSGLTLPLTLNAGQSTSFTVRFAPTTSGAATGNITITSNGSNPSLSIPLSGTGVTQGTLTANPTTLAFSNVQVGSSATLSETLTNSGGSSLTISAASATGNGYSLSGLTLPLTLTAGQSTSFTVQFAPTASGSASGNITITSNGSNPSLSIPLSGTGVTQGTLAANPTSLAFGNVQVGSSATLSETLTNSGGSSLTISAASATGNGYSLSGLTLPLTLAAGQSTSFTVQFAPTAGGAASGNITIASNGSNPSLSIPLSGTGVTQGTLTANPTSLAFGNVQVGSSATLSETLTNSGGSSLTISAASATGNGYSLSGLTLPLTLAAGQSTSFTVQFAPTASGAASGNITITSNGSNPNLSIPLSGTGATQGTLTANPTSLAFGNVQVGSSANLTETLTNSGGSSLTISAASASGNGYSLSGITLPLTLTAGQSTSFTVRFAPTASGSASGSVTITSNGSNPSLSIPLTGAGVTPGTLTPNPTSLAFSNVQVGSSATLSETLTNSGGSSLTISAASASGSGFSLSGITLPLTLNAGQSTSFTVQFAPTAGGTVTGNVTITSNGSNPSLSIPLSGTGLSAGTLGANPTSLSFGNVQVGNSANLSETVTNTGGSSVTITQANLTGAVFSYTGLTLPFTLNPTQSVTFTVTFAPTSAGSATGSLSLVSNASNSPLSIALSGTGTAAGQLAVSPTSLSFGNVVVAASSSLNGTLTASGASVTINSASINNAEFVLSGITLPKTLAAGQSTTFTVTFTPQATGATSASLSFSSNAANSPTVQSMTGTGTAPIQHSVDLTWNAAAGVMGYNVYRGTSSGGPYSMINSALDSSTSYTDNTVASGQTYYYVATSVDSGGQESAYSNQVTAVIPTP